MGSRETEEPSTRQSHVCGPKDIAHAIEQQQLREEEDPSARTCISGREDAARRALMKAVQEEGK